MCKSNGRGREGDAEGMGRDREGTRTNLNVAVLQACCLKDGLPS